MRIFCTSRISWNRISDWLPIVFHFGTENWADQSKKPPCTTKYKLLFSNHLQKCMKNKRENFWVIFHFRGRKNAISVVLLVLSLWESYLLIFQVAIVVLVVFFPLSLRIIFPDPQTQMVISGLSMEHACQWFSIVWAFVLSAQTNMAVCTFSFLNPPHVCLKTSSSSIVLYCLPGQIWQWILFYSKSAVLKTSSLTGFLIQTSHGSFWILYGSYLTSWEPFGPIWFLCRRMKERGTTLHQHQTN